MKILIIGGAGYVGSALFRYLNPRYLVHIVDLELRGNPEDGNPNSIRMDYRNLTSAFLSRYDVIVHLAGHPKVADCKADPYGAIDNNLIGFIGLVGKLNGQRLIYASSSSVYTKQDKNVYDFTKQAIDDVASLLYPNSWALRFGTVNGPSPNMRWDVVINSMVKSGLDKGEVRVANPNVHRPILGMYDLCFGIGWIIAVDTKPGVVNLASFNASIQEIADEVSKQVGCPIRYMPDTPTYDVTMDIDDRVRPTETLSSIVWDVIHHV